MDDSILTACALVARFDLLPISAARWVARLIPPLEVGIGTLLLLGFVTPWAATCALLLVSGFTLAVGTNISRGRSLPCLCFGHAHANIGWWTIYRNIGLFLLGAAVIVAPELPLTVDTVLNPGGGGDARWATLMPGIALSTVAVAAWLLFGEVAKAWKQFLEVDRRSGSGRRWT